MKQHQLLTGELTAPKSVLMIRPCCRSLVRVQSSGFRVFSIHNQLTSLDPTMLQEPPVSIHNQCTIGVHNSSSMTHHPLPSNQLPFHGIPFIFNEPQSTISASSSTNNPFSSKHPTYSPEASLIVLSSINHLSTLKTSLLFHKLSIIPQFTVIGPFNWKQQLHHEDKKMKIMNLMGKIIPINIVAFFLFLWLFRVIEQKRFSLLSIGFDKPSSVFKFWTSIR